MTVEYKVLNENDITEELFAEFHRTQIVTKCWRKVDGKWVIRDIVFTDDWSRDDLADRVKSIKATITNGGHVCGAFCDNVFKGFSAVESGIFGGENKYMDLSRIHVSQDVRGRGLGKVLFRMAAEWAKSQGARKLYISAHSAVESQAFYKSLGCVEAAEYNQYHVNKEPYDCQLEYLL